MFSKLLDPAKKDKCRQEGVGKAPPGRVVHSASSKRPLSSHPPTYLSTRLPICPSLPSEANRRLTKPLVNAPSVNSTRGHSPAEPTTPEWLVQRRHPLGHSHKMLEMFGDFWRLEQLWNFLEILCLGNFADVGSCCCCCKGSELLEIFENWDVLMF